MMGTCTQEEAAEAYDIAAIKFRGIHAVTNFDTSRYDVERICSSSSLLVADLARRQSNTNDKQQELRKASLEIESNLSGNQKGTLSLQKAESSNVNDEASNKGVGALEWSHMPKQPYHAEDEEDKFTCLHDDVSSKVNTDLDVKVGCMPAALHDVLSSHPSPEVDAKVPNHPRELMANDSQFLNENVPNSTSSNLPLVNATSPSASLVVLDGSAKSSLVESPENSVSEIDNGSPKGSSDQLEIILPGEFTKALDMVTSCEHHVPAAVFRTNSSSLNVAPWMINSSINMQNHGGRPMGHLPMFAVWNDT